MKRQPKIGLLPFYLKLYDDCMPDRRAAFMPFLDQIEGRLAASGLDVARADVCRLAAEFEAAVALFETECVDLIVTLHLAYSPSLESLEALCRTDLPLLILDTTMDAHFDQSVDADRIMYNHGVHGVMDLASMLRRRRRDFEIVAGHWEESPVLERAADIARAAYAARCLRQTRALRIGSSFNGMGDFSVAEDVMRDVLGIRVQEIPADDLIPWVERVSDADVAAEIARDRKAFDCDLPETVHAESVRLGLGLRKLLEEEEYSAFSMNFLAFDRADGPIGTVPFLEISKAMARGIGYGGEGDVLTAALVGALSRGFGDTTFTEIFCPDWVGGSLFLSHMGEINPEVAASKPVLFEKAFPFTAARNPAAIACAPRPGPGVFVNLVPGPSDTFSLVVAPVEVLADTHQKALKQTVRGWIRPECPVEQFLELYSRCGGTHHSALVLGERAEAIAVFANFAGLECTIIA